LLPSIRFASQGAALLRTSDSGLLTFLRLILFLQKQNPVSFSIVNYADITKAEADYYSGWNQIEKKISSKIVINYLINFSLFSEVFISLNGHFFYTTDSERFARVYVFDNMLPCRIEDFSSASLRNISGIDLNYEILKRALYAAPVLKWGVYNSGFQNEIDDSVLAAGVKIFFISDKIRMEASYLFETGNSVKSGSFLFSATAVY